MCPKSGKRDSFVEAVQKKTGGFKKICLQPAEKCSIIGMKETVVIVRLGRCLHRPSYCKERIA